MKLSLRFYGDPILRERAAPVAAVNEPLRSLADSMVETMHAEEGIGLAAQQVGERVALCVVDIPPAGDTLDDGTRLNPDVAMPMVLFNPEIVEFSDETEVYEEGCLSFPEIRVPVTRPAEVQVRWTDRDGVRREQHLCGLVARCVQHEMDHLNGVLICDRMSAVKKISMSGKLKRMRRETEQALGIA